MEARWRCRVPNCKGRGHDGPKGAATHVDMRHSTKDANLGAGQISFGFTSYKPRWRYTGNPAVNQPYA